MLCEGSRQGHLQNSIQSYTKINTNEQHRENKIIGLQSSWHFNQWYYLFWTQSMFFQWLRMNSLPRVEHSLLFYPTISTTSWYSAARCRTFPLLALSVPPTRNVLCHFLPTNPPHHHPHSHETVPGPHTLFLWVSTTVSVPHHKVSSHGALAIVC